MANTDLNGNRLSDWEIARNWLLHERVTRMSAKVRSNMSYIFFNSMVSLGPLINSFADRYQVSQRSEQSMNYTPT